MYVFFANLLDIPDNKILLQKYEALLSIEELKRFQEIKTKSKQKQFLVTRILLRSILMNFLQCNNQELIFEVSENGRPYLKNFTLDFNITHSKDLIFLVISDSKVGIDIEFTKKRNYLKIAQYFYTQEEFEMLEALSTDEEKQKKAFYILWTRKEALIKSQDKTIWTSFNKTDSLSMKGFKIRSFLLLKQYVLSIAHQERKQNNNLNIQKIKI